VFDELDYLGLELNTLDQEVQVAPKIATLSSTTGRPLLLLSEVRYLNPGDAVVLDVLSAIKEGKPHLNHL
jgi:DNA polymerase III alpha subunit